MWDREKEKTVPTSGSDPRGVTASITDFHSKFYAHDLSKRCSSDSPEKLAGAVASAQVDLNPHQVDAALFAFGSPRLALHSLTERSTTPFHVETHHLPMGVHPNRQMWINSDACPNGGHFITWIQQNE